MTTADFLYKTIIPTISFPNIAKGHNSIHNWINRKKITQLEIVNFYFCVHTRIVYFCEYPIFFLNIKTLINKQTNAVLRFFMNGLEPYHTIFSEMIS